MSPFNLGSELDELGPGVHDVTITRTSSGVSQSGNEKLVVVYADDDGREILDSLPAVPSMRWKWKALWSACRRELPANGRIDDDGAELVGSRVCIEVAEDTWNGRPQMKVREVFAPPGRSDIPDAEAGDFVPPASGADDDVPF